MKPPLFYRGPHERIADAQEREDNRDRFWEVPLPGDPLFRFSTSVELRDGTLTQEKIDRLT